MPNAMYGGCDVEVICQSSRVVDGCCSRRDCGSLDWAEMVGDCIEGNIFGFSPLGMGGVGDV